MAPRPVLHHHPRHRPPRRAARPRGGAAEGVPIGWFSNGSLSPGDEAFRRGSPRSGLGSRHTMSSTESLARGRSERESMLAAERIKLKIHVTVAMGAELSSQERDERDPIVFVAYGIPFGFGFVAQPSRGLAEPRGAHRYRDAPRRQGVDFSEEPSRGSPARPARELVPSIGQRVDSGGDRGRPGSEPRLQRGQVRDPTEFVAPSSDVGRDASRPVVSDDAMFPAAERIVELALKHRCPRCRGTGTRGGRRLASLRRGAASDSIVGRPPMWTRSQGREAS